MTNTVSASLFICLRGVRFLLRQPFFIAVTIVQPLMWLLLFGQLFKRVTEVPGFGTGSYITYLTPGVVVMTALFTCGWSGMALVDDMDRGIMDRFLGAPVRRSALLVGILMYEAIVTLIQALIIVGLGYILGARFDGGVGSLIAMLVGTVLLGATFASFSNAVALNVRQGESVIALVTFLQLPLTFMSTAFMAKNLTPRWIQIVERFNPVNWAVDIGRQTLSTNVDWTFVGMHLAYLTILTLACLWLSVNAFRAYQRSI
ncbi:MAG: ABC transporter permease [Nitrolancea sp.]